MPKRKTVPAALRGHDATRTREAKRASINRNAQRRFVSAQKGKP